MKFEIVNPDKVLQQLTRLDVQDGERLLVTMYLTSRDPQFSTEVYYAVHDSLDALGVFDVEVIAKHTKITIDDEREPYTTEFSRLVN